MCLAPSKGASRFDAFETSLTYSESSWRRCQVLTLQWEITCLALKNLNASGLGDVAQRWWRVTDYRTRFMIFCESRHSSWYADSIAAIMLSTRFFAL